jgi:hypothetical protein
MTRRQALIIVAACTMIVPLAAADLNGKWSGTASSSDGVETVLVILTASGSQVTGSLGPNEEKRYPIENGKLDGNKVSFDLTGPGGAVFHFDLTLDGDTLKGPCSRTRDGQTLTGSMDLKRIE